jgi:hypothetical protein
MHSPLGPRPLSWADWAVWIIPAAFLTLLIHGPGFALLENRQQRQIELAELERNIYREDWLDSAQTALLQDLHLGETLIESAQEKLSPFSDGDTAMESLRSAAHESGLEVLRSLAKTDAHPPQLWKDAIRLEGRGTFAELQTYWKTLASDHRYAFPEEMLVRLTESDPTRLEFQITLAFYRNATRPERLAQ